MLSDSCKGKQVGKSLQVRFYKDDMYPHHIVTLNCDQWHNLIGETHCELDLGY